MNNLQTLAQIVKDEGAHQLLLVLALLGVDEPAISADHKLCGGQHGCGKQKLRFVDFAARRLRCEPHRRKAAFDPSCALCLKATCKTHQPNVAVADCVDCKGLLTDPANRQPRCKECDVRRKAVTVRPVSNTVAIPNATPIKVPAERRQRIVPRAGEPAIKRINRHEFKGPPSQGPRLILRKAKTSGAKNYPQTQPTEIMRMIAALFTREERIKDAEDLVGVVRGQINTVETLMERPSTTRYAELLGLLKEDLSYAQQRLGAVRAWRDFTSQKIRLFLDHALSTTPFQERLCECRGGSSKTIPLTTCKTCGGRGTIRAEKTNHYAKAAVEKLKHLKKVLPVTELCAKVKAKNSESEAAFKQLLANNVGLIKKFGSEKQTSMEQDDAEQGASIGIYDAAIRFNPVKPECYLCTRCGEKAQIPTCEKCEGDGEVSEHTCKECQGFGSKPKAGGMACVKCKNPRMMLKTSTADFKTYAYNWAYRNSRARKETDKRAGVYAPSVEGLTQPDDDSGIRSKGDRGGTAIVAGISSSVGKFSHGEVEDQGGLLTMDLKTQISQLEGQQKEVINYTLAGLSLSEIAAALGVSKATVSKLRDTAYETLRKRMAGYCEGQDEGDESDE